MLNLALISPLLALATAEIFGLSPELAVGLVLLGASPGGMMANMLTHLSRGDTALSVTMTAISSVGAIVTVPLFLALSTSHFDADDGRRREHARRRRPRLRDHDRAGRDRDGAAPRGTRPGRGRLSARAHVSLISLRAGRPRRDRQRARHGRRERGRGRRRGARPQRRGDDDQLRDLQAGPARRPPGDGDRARARHPQRGAGDRRRRLAGRPT